MRISDTQKCMQQSADRRILDMCNTFNEIMIGPNPLTKDEISKLIAKRPEVYSILEAWAH